MTGRAEEQIREDLKSVFHSVPLDCLTHFRDNMHRLIRGSYKNSDNDGRCLFGLLTQTLPDPIESKDDLIRFFGVQYGRPGQKGFVHPRNSEEYQPAKWLVRAWDGQEAPRYGDYGTLTKDFVREVLLEVIADREEIERLARAAEASSAA